MAHPLLRSWARSSRETLILLGDRIEAAAVDPPAGSDVSTGTTLLARVQQDLRADNPPDATLVPEATDRSVRIHSCHGITRQVEVLRDQLLHLLAGGRVADRGRHRGDEPGAGGVRADHRVGLGTECR